MENFPDLSRQAAESARKTVERSPANRRTDMRLNPGHLHRAALEETWDEAIFRWFAQSSRACLYGGEMSGIVDKILFGSTPHRAPRLRISTTLTDWLCKVDGRRYLQQAIQFREVMPK